MTEADLSDSQPRWYVMRDLKRANAAMPAYRQLAEMGYEVFTPLTTRVRERGGKRQRVQVPFIQDLLFVHATKDKLDETVRRIETLQYRYVKGGAYCEPMTVPTADMERFITAVSSVETPRYYRIDELTPAMYGSRIRMIADNSLNGLEGTLLKVRGSGKKRLLVELPGFLAAAIEITTADFVTLL